MNTIINTTSRYSDNLNGHVETRMFIRSEHNPILQASDFPGIVNAVFNAGAARYNGQTVLLVRVEDRSGLSKLMVVVSDDGVTNWQVDPERGLFPDIDSFEERWGVEDPRITQIDDMYYITYTGFSEAGPLICLATTRDFVDFERHGMLLPPEDKNSALFPVQFGGRWALIHRPSAYGPAAGAHIWLSYSPDLKHWGDGRVIIPAREGGWWDANKVGIGPPPLLTRQGWLVCYHGVRQTAAGHRYRLGLALLSARDPGVVLARSNEWVFAALEPYEQTGDVPGVVFPCGWLLSEDGEQVNMYYGAADTSLCLATAEVQRLLDHVQRHPLVQTRH